VHDEADRHLVVVVVIKERAATGRIVQGPAERMLDQPLLVFGGIDFPDLLQANAEFRRLAFGVEREFCDQLLAQAAARTFGEQRVLAEQFHAAGVGVLAAAVPGDAHVAGGDTAHRALVVVKHLGRGKTRVDFDAERLRLRRQPAADIAERADIAVMVVHQRRHREVRQPDRAGRRRPVETVVLYLGFQRTIGVLTPVRDQPVEANRIDHRARQNMRADLGTLLDHDDVEVGVELLQPDRCRQACRPGADDHDVEFHGFARRKFFGAHDLVPARLRRLLKVALFPIFAARTTMEMQCEAFRARAIPPERDRF
jgi:hypothetical protein